MVHVEREAHMIWFTLYEHLMRRDIYCFDCKTARAHRGGIVGFYMKPVNTAWRVIHTFNVVKPEIQIISSLSSLNRRNQRTRESRPRGRGCFQCSCESSAVLGDLSLIVGALRRWPIEEFDD